MTDLFTPADAKTLAEALYVRSIVRTGAATPDALHELQERAVKASLAFAAEWNADLPVACPSVEVKNLTTDRIFRRQDAAEEKAARGLVELLNAARKRIKANLGDLPATSRSREMLQQVLGATTDALGRATRELQSTLAGSVQDAMALGVELAEEMLGKVEAAVPFGFNDDLLRNIATYHASLVQDITDATRAAITREVQLGILAGTDGREIARKIVATGVEATGPFPTAERRADVVARTEINRVGSMATAERYNDAATRIENLTKSWLTAGDVRVRPEHRALNGVTLPMDGLFDVGGEKAPYPMWPGLSAAQTVNCRCRLLAKVAPEAG